MAKEALFDKVPIPAENLHRVHGEAPPEQAAADYERTLIGCFGGDPINGKAPERSPDLVLLGMGDNGHTASLFPGLPAITETRRWVMAQYVEVAGMWRVTLTPVFINAARCVAFLVSGVGKAAILSRVLEGPYEPTVLPSQIVAPTHGALNWLIDRAAAAELKSAT